MNGKPVQDQQISMGGDDRHPCLLAARLILILIGVFILLAWSYRPVSAHAMLQHSSPPDGAVLASAPSEVEMEFTERLDPSFSTIQLLDNMGMVVVKGPGEMAPGNEYAMRLPLPALPDGVYTAVWKARSAQDGHITNGSISFSVGKAAPLASILPPVGSATPALTLPPLLDTFLRFLTFMGACGLAGAFLFGLGVWYPAYRRLQAFGPGQDEFLRVILLRQAHAAALLAGVATLALLPEQAELASQGPFFQSLGGLLAGQTGLVMAARLILLFLLGWWAGKLPVPGGGPTRRWWVAIVAGAVVLLTFSLQSHAFASGSAISVGIDWLHLLAVSAWIGGLVPLGLLLRQGGAYPKLVPYFSLVALISVDTIASSGVYSLLINSGSLPALSQTTYGLALMAKIALFMILVTFGAVNLLLLSPRLSLEESRAARWLSRNVRTEVIVAAFVLMAAGVLTGVAPGDQALQAQQRIGFVRTASAGGVGMTFIITPGVVGDNEFGLDVADPRGLAQSDVVLMRLTQLDQNMGQIQVDMKFEEPMRGAPAVIRRYTARGSYLGMVGNWQVDLIVRQAGKNDITQRFYLQLGSVTHAPGQLVNPVVPDAANLADAKDLYQQRCAACHGPLGKGDGPVGRTLYPPPADLTLHGLPGVHSDADLFGWITGGYPGSAMPAFDRTLTDKQRWDLVNFIRVLAQPK